METSRVSRSLKERSAGLTLIEVMIALAIVGISMTAIIKAASQNIRSTGYVQNKSIAVWVGQQVINEARVNLLQLPNPPDKLKQTTTMLHHEWLWTAAQESTPNTRIKKAIVKVFANADADEEETTPSVILESYVYHEE
jgi:general secretion pathway protein I